MVGSKGESASGVPQVSGEGSGLRSGVGGLFELGTQKVSLICWIQVFGNLLWSLGLL